ncbi:hypothetical protein FOZ63_021178 [Perkinsus olseni]|uniref:Sterol carrier protein 2 n=1 Tax=Perkinsus olseni TaxID=32597 RepID=A0A7J6TLG0_PEROL|nr:hypothetical protein FOZ63_021178 [Perkinsus olseni]
MASANKVYVVGGGVCPFRMPKSKDCLDYTEYARIACTKALEDAGLKYEDITVAVAAWNYGDTAAGHRALYEMGLTGIPIINTNVNCSAGSCGVFLGRSLLKAGICGDVCLVLGMEQMERGLSESKYTDRENPVGPQLKHVHELGSPTELIKPGMNQWTSDVCRMFAGAADEYAERHCAEDREKFCRYLADITVKNRAHGTQNPDACIRSATTREKVLRRPFCGSISEPMSVRVSNIHKLGGIAAGDSPVVILSHPPRGSSRVMRLAACAVFMVMLSCPILNSVIHLAIENWKFS